MDNGLLRALLDRVSNSDQEAFTELYKLTRQQLFVSAIQIVTKKELADETVQEAFVQIWLNAGSFQKRNALVLTWMKRIVRYRALDCLRYHKVRKEEPLTKDNSPSCKAEDADLQRSRFALLHQVESLQAKQCDSIKLIYFSGLTHSEATAHMGENLGTVKSWVRRGLKELRVSVNIQSQNNVLA